MDAGHYVYPTLEQSFHLVRTSILHDVLDVLADPWNLSILRALFHGPLRFDELIERLGVSRAALSVRLNTLYEQQCLDKQAYGNSGKRFEYSITAQGRALKPVFLLLDQWNRRWLGEVAAPDLGLCCDHCKEPLHLRIECRHCSQELRPSHVKPLFMRGPLAYAASVPDYRRTRSAPGSEKVEDPLQISAEVWLRDRWSSLLIGGLLFGLRRYGDLQSCLDIAPNILANRLDILLSAQMLARQDDGGYALRTRGLELYPVIMAMREGGMRSLPIKPMVEQGWDLLHVPCTSWLSLDYTCVACGTRIALD